ncbi:MAG: hypothetical protein HC881_19280 [Leptolyngbyaceae cyanobacterium SL_7_1]|nr:hypothetical protein [Leptolyngbyaceae cyanobacterium SL_7_1]
MTNSTAPNKPPNPVNWQTLLQAWHCWSSGLPIIPSTTKPNAGLSNGQQQF